MWTNNIPSGSRPIGAVTLSTHIEEVADKNNAPFVAVAIMPLAVLGSGSETKDVSVPLTIAHLCWTCSLIGPGSDEPITVNSMLDCGAHVVLIGSMLADQLGLCHYCLYSPLPISIALDNSSSSDSHLHEYIKFVPYVPSLAWISQTVKLIVTLNLCVPLLLGLPFLTVNHIVADFKTHTTINKEYKYDLLNPPSQKPDRRLVDPKHVIQHTKKGVKAMLPELVEICKQCLKDGKHVPEPMKLLNVARMIKDHIEVLMFQANVGKLETDFLTEFKDVFEPLPHVDKLLQDVTVQIKLKNAEHAIKIHTYFKMLGKLSFSNILTLAISGHHPHCMLLLLSLSQNPTPLSCHNGSMITSS